MEFIKTIIEHLLGPNGTMIILTVVTALLAVSEALAYIPGIAANSVFQAVHNGLKKIISMLTPKKI